MCDGLLAVKGCEVYFWVFPLAGSRKRKPGNAFHNPSHVTTLHGHEDLPELLFVPLIPPVGRENELGMGRTMRMQISNGGNALPKSMTWPCVP